MASYEEGLSRTRSIPMILFRVVLILFGILVILLAVRPTEMHHWRIRRIFHDSFLSPGTHLLLGATFGPGAVDDSYSLELEHLGKERVPASRRMADGTDRLVGKIPAHAARACSPASPQPYQAFA